MTQDEARELAGSVRDGLPMRMRQRLKAVHVAERLHNGHLTLRVFMVPLAAEDPEVWIFADNEI